MQLWSRKNGSSVTNKDVISTSQVRDEASSAGALFLFFDRMITATSCCRFSVQQRGPPNARNVVVAELVEDTQEHRLFEKLKDLQRSLAVTMSLRIASSDECNEAVVLMCKKLLHKRVPLALLYFIPATLFNIPLVEGLCIGLLAFCARLFSEETQNLDIYRTKLCIVFCSSQESEERRYSRESHSSCFFVTQVFVPGYEKIATIQELVAVVMQTLCRSEEHSRKGRTNPSAAPSLPTEHRSRWNLPRKHSRASPLRFPSISPIRLHFFSPLLHTL